MKLTVMLSTMNNIVPKFFEKNIGKTIVVNQTNDIDSSFNVGTVLINSNSKGLSKSRNIAIENLFGDYAFIADNDISYVLDYSEIVNYYFDLYPEADILTFQIKDENNNLYKNYKKNTFKHNKFSILRVSSVEIVFRVDSVKMKGIKFDEKFGLGAKYKSGEENIFLMECLNKGLCAYYINVPIVIHPLESSGKLIDDNFFFNRGAVFCKIFGSIYVFPMILYFSLKKSDGVFKFFRNIFFMFKGVFSLREDERLK